MRSILWRSADKAQAAADALKLTAQDLQQLELIDEVVPEPIGGAHRDPAAIIATLGDRISATLDVLLALDGGCTGNAVAKNFSQWGAPD